MKKNTNPRFGAATEIDYWKRRAARYYEAGDHRKAHDCAVMIQRIKEGKMAPPADAAHEVAK